MRSLRYVLMLLAVLTVASVAEAQCMYCQQQPGQTGDEGICVESNGDYCTTDCCRGWLGMSCSTWGAFHGCGWWLASQADTNRPLMQRAIRRSEAAFTSRLLLEHTLTRTQRRLQPCGV